MSKSELEKFIDRIMYPNDKKEDRKNGGIVLKGTITEVIALLHDLRIKGYDKIRFISLQ